MENLLSSLRIQKRGGKICVLSEGDKKGIIQDIYGTGSGLTENGRDLKEGWNPV